MSVIASEQQGRNAIKLHPCDNVAIALQQLPKGKTLDEESVTLAVDIARGHKVALQAIGRGQPVLKYGQVIGQASQPINPGDHVHCHNLEMADHQYQSNVRGNAFTREAAIEKRYFMGYRRDNGSTGTRNYIGIVTSVNCAGSVARFIAETAEKKDLLAAYSNIDGVVPISHGSGCGMSSSGDGYETLRRTLAGYIQHPNFGGILLIGLGCEVMQLSQLVDSTPGHTEGSFRRMTIQNSGGTRQTVEKGLQALQEIAQVANSATRTRVPVSEISLGLQCGGSDGYSGVTANPALGFASDLLVGHGSVTILSETPEIYGAEHLLTCRAETAEIADKLTDRIRWWEDYCHRNGGAMDNNPSPGNKLGGLTTILEKSLGAVAKSGSAPLCGVYQYAQPINKKGFVFMDSPGFDPCSATGQIASGANLIVFTTGRGSVSGFKPTPCIKLASNSDMYRKLSEDMDLNCGDIIDSAVSIEQKGLELFELLIKVASGEKTKSEALGFGGTEFVPWQIGAVM